MHAEYDPQDPDWEGVEVVHTHDDGTRLMRVHLEVPVTPWWRAPVLLRYFRTEIVVICAYIGAMTGVMVVMGFSWAMLVTVLAVVFVMVMGFVRATITYRTGFSMGMAVVPLAQAQKTPRHAAELVQRSSHLWDPHPQIVAHRMEVERLERDVNRGTL